MRVLWECDKTCSRMNICVGVDVITYEEDNCKLYESLENVVK